MLCITRYIFASELKSTAIGIFKLCGTRLSFKIQCNADSAIREFYGILQYSLIYFAKRNPLNKIKKKSFRFLFYSHNKCLWNENESNWKRVASRGGSSKNSMPISNFFFLNIIFSKRLWHEIFDYLFLLLMPLLLLRSVPAAILRAALS